MANGNAPYKVRYGLLGGVNNTFVDESIDDNELSTCINFEPDPNSNTALIKREGMVAYSLSVGAEVPRSMYEGIFAHGQYLATSTGGNIKIYDLGATALLTTVASASGRCSWTTFSTYDICAVGAAGGAVKTDDGALFTAVANWPAGAYLIASANNFLYAAGYTGVTGARIRWANAGTVETWPVVNELILSEDESDMVLSIRPWRNALFVLCSKSFWLITHFATLAPQVYYYSREVETGSWLAHDRVVTTQSGVFWMTVDGIVWLKPDLSIDYPMKRKLRATMQGLRTDLLTFAHAVHDNLRHRVMFFYPVDAIFTTMRRIDYYYLTDTFYIHEAMHPYLWYCSAVLSGPTYTPTLFTGGSTGTIGVDDSYVWRIGDWAADHGTNISAYLETKCQSDPGIMRRIRNVSVSTNLEAAHNLTYGVYVDGAAALTDTYTLSSVAAGKIETVVGVNRSCKKIKHRISDASAYRGKILGITEVGEQVRTI